MITSEWPLFVHWSVTLCASTFFSLTDGEPMIDVEIAVSNRLEPPDMADAVREVHALGGLLGAEARQAVSPRPAANDGKGEVG